MKRYPILALCSTLLLLLPPSSRLASAAALLKDIAKPMRQMSSMLTSTLQGTLPSTYFNQITTLFDKVPVPTTINGQGIDGGRLIAALFPNRSRDLEARGTLAFSLSARRSENMDLSVRIDVHVKGVETGFYAFHASELSLLIRLRYSRNTKNLTGTIRCEAVSPRLLVTAPGTRWGAAKLAVTGTIHNRSYFLSVSVKELSCPEIPLDERAVRNLHVDSCTASPRSLQLKGISFRYMKTPVSIEAASFDLSALSLKATGTIDLRWSFLSRFLPSLKKIDGKVNVALMGAFSPGRPVLAASLSSDNLRISGETETVSIERVETRVKIQGEKLSVPVFRLSSAKGIRISGALTTKTLSRPLDGSDARVALTIDDLETLRPYLQFLYPTIPSQLTLSGPLTSRIHCCMAQGKAAIQGTLHYEGNVADPSVPVACEKISLDVPINLQLGKMAESKSPGPTKKGEITIGKVRVGFLSLDHFTVRIAAPLNRFLAETISFSLFKGHAQGKGEVRLATPFPWKLVLNMDQVSLHDVCARIPGFQDALSGKVKTSLTLCGNGGKLPSMKGSFNAETVQTGKEPLRISQKFIRKLTGKKGRFFFFQTYRPYDKGVIRARIVRGIVIFDKFELTHKFFGFKDLSIAVSRLSNKISIKDLIWEILQVSEANVDRPVIKTN